MKSKFYIVGLVVLIGLAGCKPVYDFNFMPSGYGVEEEEPKVDSILTQEQRHAWRNAVYEVVSRLTQRAGLPPKPVFVAYSGSQTPFYDNFDNDLREVLLESGYQLSASPDDSYGIIYSVRGLKPKRNKYIKGNVELTLKVYSSQLQHGEFLTEETATFYIDGADGLQF